MQAEVLAEARKQDAEDIYTMHVSLQLKCTDSQAAGRIQGYIHNAHSILPQEYLKKYSFQTWMTLFLLQNNKKI